MGNSKISRYSPSGKQNIPTQKGSEKSSHRGKLTICSKQLKNGNKIFFIIFHDISSNSSKLIKWRHGQFQIFESNDYYKANITQECQIGEFTETQIIDAIKWSSMGAFNNKKTTISSEWCECVCWKLGKKVTLA